MAIEIFKTQLNVSKANVYTEFKDLLTSAYDWSSVTEDEEGTSTSFHLTDTLYLSLLKKSDGVSLTLFDKFGNTKMVSMSMTNYNMILRKCGNALAISIESSGNTMKSYGSSFKFIVSKIDNKPCVLIGEAANINIYSDERNGNVDVSIVFDSNIRNKADFSTQLANVYDPYLDKGTVDNVYQMLYCSAAEGERFSMNNVEYVRGTNLVIGGIDYVNSKTDNR